MERVVSKEKKEEFVDTMLSFISENQWTISNFYEATFEVVEHMEKNAILKELTVS